jgi:opacity protein-like surface antigen
MRKVGLLLVLAALLAVPAIMGQDEYPKAEIFGGFSYMNFDSGGGERYNALGWQASAAGNFHKNVGIVGDLGGQYKSIEGTTVWVYEYLFGPRFYYRTEKSTVFAHTLFGGATAGGGGESETAFAMGYGAGVDVKISDRVAFRVMQVDYVPMHKWGEWFNSFRLGVGIVFTSGK